MTFEQVAPFVSAGAALLAAVLAGINLYISGRRQQVGWTRQALEKACVDFLTAHYEHWDACSALEELSDRKESRKSEESVYADIDQADRRMMRCVTRFRVLASPDLVRAALNLRRFNSLRLEGLAGPTPSRHADTGLNEARESHRDIFVHTVQGFLRVAPQTSGRVSRFAAQGDEGG